MAARLVASSRYARASSGKRALPRDLSDTVFGYVFLALDQALARADGKPATALDTAALEEVRQGALILLYRLLLVLYAEDRNLLPDASGPYADYSLAKLRNEIAEKKSRGAVSSDRMKAYWSLLDGVFHAIAITASAFHPTMAACSIRQPRRYWRASNSPTPPSLMLCSAFRTSTPMMKASQIHKLP